MTIGFILLTVTGLLILFGVGQRVLDRLRLTDVQAIVFIALIIAGGFVPDIPVTERFAFNIGGALIPLALCVWLWIKAGSARERARCLVASVITALAALKEPCEITLTSDSKYVIDGIEKGWAESWKARGWKKADKSPALNPDLWDRLLSELARHKVEFVWVRGHAGHPYNERCDALATAFADSLK